MSVLYKTNVEEAISNKPNSATAFNLTASATQADGLRNVLAAYADTEQLPYFVSDDAGLWEDGIGTVTSTTLVRAVINESSNSGSAVDFSSGGALTLIVGASAKQSQIAGNRHSLLTIVEGDSGTLQTLSSVVISKITGLKTIVKDEFGFWDAANNRFHPNVAGFYKINVHAQIRALADNKYYYVLIYKNDVSDKMLARAYSGTINSYIGSNNCAIFSMNGSTDYLDIRVYNGDSTSRELYSTPGQLNFSAEYIGEL